MKKIFLVIALLMLGTGAEAQWNLQKVFPLPNPGDPPGLDQDLITSIYFLDLPGPPRIGFVGIESPEWYDTTYEGGEVWKTTNGGSTWYQVGPVNDRPFFGQSVNGFTFKDSLTGWLAAGLENGGAYKTTDGGETWILLPDAGVISEDYGASCVYYQSYTNRLFQNVDGSTYSEWTSDDGATWHDMGFWFLGCAFSDDTTGIMSGDENGAYPIHWTSDGGITWTATSLDLDCVQPLAIKGTKTFFILDIQSKVYRTDDGGATWRLIYQFTDGLSGGVNNTSTTERLYGDLQHIYAQTLNAVYVSTDEGVSWQSLCGPGNGNIFIKGFYARDNYIYASQYEYGGYGPANLWYLNIDSVNRLYTFSSTLAEQFPDGSKRTGIRAGSNVTVNYVPHTDTLVGVDSVRLAIHYDSASLSLNGIHIPSPWVLHDSSWRGNVLDLLLTDTSAEPLPSPILQLSFGTFLTSSLSAKVYLDSAHLYGHRLNCDCAVESTLTADTSSLASAIDSVEIDFTGCGDSILLAAMNGTLPFVIESIQPNPASSSIDVTFSGVRVPGSGIDCTLFNALGESVLTQHSALSTQHLDISNFPSGIYYIRLSSNGYVQSRQIVIER